MLQISRVPLLPSKKAIHVLTSPTSECHLDELLCWATSHNTYCIHQGWKTKCTFGWDFEISEEGQLAEVWAGCRASRRIMRHTGTHSIRKPLPCLILGPEGQRELWSLARTRGGKGGLPDRISSPRGREEVGWKYSTFPLPVLQPPAGAFCWCLPLA